MIDRCVIKQVLRIQRESKLTLLLTRAAIRVSTFTLTNEGAVITSSLEYRERARIQCLHWAMGKSYHNDIDNECCPDFSCCYPDLFERNEAKRWKQYHREYGMTQ